MRSYRLERSILIIMIRSMLWPAVCLFSVVGLAACAPNTLPPVEGSAESASPTTGGPLEGTPEPDSEYAESAQTDSSLTRYACTNGQTISVAYPNDHQARLTYRDDTRTLKAALSADGVRYVDDRYEWWTRGTGANVEATLFSRTDNGSTGRPITTCHPD